MRLPLPGGLALRLAALGGASGCVFRMAALAASAIVGGQSQTARGSGAVNRPSQQHKPYVVVVSFDGFRADYLDRFKPPNFERVSRWTG